MKRKKASERGREEKPEHEHRPCHSLESSATRPEGRSASPQAHAHNWCKPCRLSHNLGRRDRAGRGGERRGKEETFHKTSFGETRCICAFDMACARKLGHGKVGDGE